MSIEEAGLTTASYPVLEMIVQNPGVTQQEISDQVSLDKSCTSRACKALEAGGFIRREKSLNSAHAFRCYPTEKAPAVVKRITQQEARHIHDLFSAQDPEDIVRVSAFLVELTEKMRKEYIPPPSAVCAMKHRADGALRNIRKMQKTDLHCISRFFGADDRI